MVERNLVLLREQVLQKATSYLGAPSVPYTNPENGQDPENGFDCSGFVTRVLEETGIDLPRGIRHSNEYFDKFGILIHAYKPGDLIFYSYKGTAPNHMGIIYDEDSYIHAPGRINTQVEIKKIKRTPINASGEEVIYTHNPIGFKRIAMQEGRWYKI